MLSKIKSCFFKLPIIRKWKHRRDQLNIKRGIETLNGLKCLIKNSTYTITDIAKADAALEKLSIESTTITRLHRLHMVNLYSQSSQAAMETIRKEYFDKETLIRQGGIYLNLKEKPLNCWMSNHNSVHNFLLLMQEKIKQNVLLEIGPEDASKHIESNGQIQKFINSMLFRLLLTDFLEITVLILEINYETNERKI